MDIAQHLPRPRRPLTIIMPHNITLAITNLPIPQTLEVLLQLKERLPKLRQKRKRLHLHQLMDLLMMIYHLNHHHLHQKPNPQLNQRRKSSLPTNSKAKWNTYIFISQLHQRRQKNLQQHQRKQLKSQQQLQNPLLLLLILNLR